MKIRDVVEVARRLAKPYRVTDGDRFRLRHVHPGDTAWFDDSAKPAAEAALQEGVEALAELQDMLWAQDRWAVLLVFQALDAAGKDGAVKHVMSGVNPQGCEVHSFKAPSAEELDHDFLWRAHCRVPSRGRIGIFNRSYYEDVLVVRVHPEILAAQKLAPSLVGKDIWKQRFADIRHFERYLGRNGVVVRKFFLHVSRDEQKRRFLERLDEPRKHWKFSANDVAERVHWKAYQHAYDAAIRATATPDAPWYVVPADNKWFTRLVVAAAIIDALASLDLHYPTVPPRQRAALAAARKRLEAEK
jgi:PPK2 family polyphosphate:nucleotide phosphotransferase